MDGCDEGMKGLRNARLDSELRHGSMKTGRDLFLERDDGEGRRQIRSGERSGGGG